MIGRDICYKSLQKNGGFMKYTVMIFSLVLTVSTFARSVESYDQVILMKKGDSVVSDETWTIQNARIQTPQNIVVKCVESLPENYQQLSNQGLINITTNQSAHLANTLHVCL